MKDTLSQFIDRAAKLNVLVVGETITDAFVKVRYEGHSMKSFCPVFRIDEHSDEQLQEGGALAIANHLRDFVKDVEIITNDRSEIVKKRFIDINSGQKHEEMNLFNVKSYEKQVDYARYDVVIIADFGHGFCDQLDLPENAHVMCQTNSNNFGFNRISKWKNVAKKSICIDIREASLQMNRKVDLRTTEDFMELYDYELNSSDLYVTLGKSGVIFTDGKKVEQHPSFKTDIVDTIGAGDAFFAFASLMSHLEWPMYDRLLIPSLAASLTTTWLANENHVTKENLQKHATRFI
jgi:bifunctional ADP-heptose synthase (sugar kinase/adenylyltransferase)